MIDIKFLRENPDVVKENIKKKFQDEKLVLVDEVIDLDIKNREAKLNGDNLRAERKSLSNEIGNLMKQGKKDEAESIKSKVKEIYNIENVTVIDKGIPSSSPYNVNYMKNVAIFGMIGMIASCGILFILFYFDTRIKSKSEVEELLGLEVLGVIPEIKA